LNMKVLILLAITLLAAFSTIATVAATFEIPAPASSSTTQTVVVTTSSGYIQPTGDPINDPVAPDNY